MSTQPPKPHGPEPFEVGRVPGVTGVVRSQFSVWDGLSFIAGGRRVKPRGLRRRVLLPARPRPVVAHLKGGLLLPGAEKLVVDGQAYPTGPPAPEGLRVLAMMSGLTLLLVKPMWGFPAAWLAVHLNIAVVRSARPTRVKAALIVAIVGAAVAVNLVLAAAVGHPFDS